MKIRSAVKLLTTAVFSLWLINACADQTIKPAGSSASSAAMTAIANASEAIDMAKANDWIWRDTESILDEARAAAASGDNDTAVRLAEEARLQAENAVIQYNYEKAHPRGL
ncbi:MAG: hypothetical protein PVJ66_08895 [Gammaproteobacteria bacterium]